VLTRSVAQAQDRANPDQSGAGSPVAESVIDVWIGQAVPHGRGLSGHGESVDAGGRAVSPATSLQTCPPNCPSTCSIPFARTSSINSFAHAGNFVCVLRRHEDV
jgi:hypothetical protein